MDGFSPDGRTLAATTTSDQDDTTLWDVGAGASTIALRDIARDGPVAFLPDGVPWPSAPRTGWSCSGGSTQPTWSGDCARW